MAKERRCEEVGLVAPQRLRRKVEGCLANLYVVEHRLLKAGCERSDIRRGDCLRYRRCLRIGRVSFGRGISLSFFVLWLCHRAELVVVWERGVCADILYLQRREYEGSRQLSFSIGFCCLLMGDCTKKFG